jgi:hypothetical protein
VQYFNIGMGTGNNKGAVAIWYASKANKIPRYIGLENGGIVDEDTAEVFGPDGCMGNVAFGFGR